MRKKLFAILMSAMMMVTFMPAMAFAASEAEVTSINWTSDYTGAYVTVEGIHRDILVEAEIEKYAGGFATLAVITNAKIDEAFPVSVKDLTKTDKLYKELYKVAIDVSKVGVNVANGTEFRTWNGKSYAWVDAGDYSAWYENKDAKEDDDYYGIANPVEVTGFYLQNGRDKINIPTTYADKLFKVTYPEYQAYDFDTEKNQNKIGKITIEPSAEALQAVAALEAILPTAFDAYLGNIRFTATQKTVDVMFDVNGLNPYYTEWTSVKDASDDDNWGRGELQYRGRAYTPEFLHAALNTTDTFKIEKWEDKDGDKDWDEDEWTVVDEMKNVGDYKVTATRVLNKAGVTNRTFTDVAYYTIHARLVNVEPVAAYFWKNYNGEGFEFTDKALKIQGLCDGDALLKEDMTTPAKVGDYFLTITDKDINENYTLGENGGVRANVSIYQAENSVTCPTTNKTVKYSKVKKAAQKVTVKTTSTFGEVKLTKVSGSAKLKVNGNKIVVKKGTKKGTYKIKVRASVVGTEDYKSAKITKTITIRVK